MRFSMPEVRACAYALTRASTAYLPAPAFADTLMSALIVVLLMARLFICRALPHAAPPMEMRGAKTYAPKIYSPLSLADARAGVRHAEALR